MRRESGVGRNRRGVLVVTIDLTKGQHSPIYEKFPLKKEIRKYKVKAMVQYRDYRQYHMINGKSIKHVLRISVTRWKIYSFIRTSAAHWWITPVTAISNSYSSWRLSSFCWISAADRNNRLLIRLFKANFFIDLPGVSIDLDTTFTWEELLSALF